jgi:preprotein translocase subunit YajC
MANLFLTIGAFAWLVLVFIGFGHMVYTSIRDDYRREKQRKEALKKVNNN